MEQIGDTMNASAANNGQEDEQELRMNIKGLYLYRLL